MKRKPTAAERAARRQAKLRSRGDDAMKTVTRGLIEDDDVKAPTAGEEKPRAVEPMSTAETTEVEPEPEPSREPTATLRNRKEGTSLSSHVSSSVSTSPSSVPSSSVVPSETVEEALAAKKPKPEGPSLLDVELHARRLSRRLEFLRFIVHIAVAVLFGWGSLPHIEDDTHPIRLFLAIEVTMLVLTQSLLYSANVRVCQLGFFCKCLVVSRIECTLLFLTRPSISLSIHLSLSSSTSLSLSPFLSSFAQQATRDKLLQEDSKEANAVLDFLQSNSLLPAAKGVDWALRGVSVVRSFVDHCAVFLFFFAVSKSCFEIYSLELSSVCPYLARQRSNY